MTDNRLKSFADRLDALEEEKKGISGDIKDVFVEVKSAGYNAKALRKVLAERRKKTDAGLEADIDLYRAALAEPGATYRSVAEKTGASKSKLQRLVPRKENGTSPAHDADGVITETEESCGDAGSASATHNSHHVGHAEGAVAAPPVSPHDTDHVPDARNMDEAPATTSVGAVASESERVAPPDDAEAIAAMDAAYEALQEARARRQTQEAGV